MNNRDIRVVVLLDASEYTWSKEEAERQDLSHSAYIRSLITNDHNRVDRHKLSLTRNNINTPSPTQNDAQLIVSLARHIVRSEVEKNT